MLYEQKMTGPIINWPGGKPKDRPDPGTNPEVSAHLRQWDCRVEFQRDHYELINKHGDAIEMSLTSSLQEWADACKQLGEYRRE